MIVVGVNHRNVPLELLERMTVPAERLPKALHDLVSREHVTEAVVLSTCNRTEIYATAEKYHGAMGDVRNSLSEMTHVAPEAFADHLYAYHDTAAVAHLFSVAAGLDSAVIGESEILGQVRQAWEAATAEGAAGPGLHMLFRHALEVGKRARTDTGIGRSMTSVSSAAVALAAERLGTLDGKRVLVLGAGEMGEGMAVSLAAAGVAEVLVANRTPERARALAERVGGRAVPLFELPQAVVEVDLLLTSTGATSVMVEYGEVEEIVAKRAGRELLIIDVAVPRDVNPSAADLPGVTLLDMDDLRAFADTGLAERRREATRARDIVDEEVSRYRDASTARQVAPVVTAFRDRAEVLRLAEVERLGRKLSDVERAALEALSKGLVAKLLHEPTVRLKDAAGTVRGERLAEALRELFDLE
ncbi:MAG: glutamyl-tRNA reductase [Acidimicrobiales bacterium]|nr:glutamyl-tRNA reductase [Acidimicrobiales bacterium]